MYDDKEGKATSRLTSVITVCFKKPDGQD